MERPTLEQVNAARRLKGLEPIVFPQWWYDLWEEREAKSAAPIAALDAKDAEIARLKGEGLAALVEGMQEGDTLAIRKLGGQYNVALWSGSTLDRPPATAPTLAAALEALARKETT